jgi:hypothetical protein
MFSRLAQIVAWIALIMGLWRLAMGISIASGWMTPAEAVLKRYFGDDSIGEVINEGTYMTLFGLGLGTLAEIGLALRKRAASPTEK